MVNVQHDPDNPTIYHPNGYISHRAQELQSDSIVFSDEEFSDQLIQSLSGEFSSLTHYYSQNTCLFIGLSFRDATLRHLLRQARKLAPGNMHYLIFHVDKNEKRNENVFPGLFRAHFAVHNLYTMFLRDDEILSLLKWLSISQASFRDLKEEYDLPAKFVYYVTRAPAVGKSTVVATLRAFGVVNEWVEPNHPYAARDFGELSQEQKQSLDRWISRQFRLKNRFLQEELEGIFIVDRAPLDPLAYESDHATKVRRAKLDRDEIRKSGRDLHEGAIILLRGDERELKRRQLLRDKNWKGETIDFLSHAIESVYSNYRLLSVETSDFSQNEVVGRILEVMMLEDYVPSRFVISV